MENQTVLYTLVLSGLSDLPSLTLLCSGPQFPSPNPTMYFFLGKLASISLLAVMSYDRYVAICHPLHYTQIMHWKACVLLVLGVLMFGLVHSLVHVLLLLKLTFCRLTPLQSSFCNLPQLLLVSCSDTFINVLLILVLGTLLAGGFFTLTFCPYIIILNTIMKMQSKAMRSKAFSTCSSHLTVVFIFYGTGLFSYFHPIAKDHSAVDKVASVFYTVLTPLVNPLIYSLRNEKMKISLKRALCRFIESHKRVLYAHAPLSSCSGNAVISSVSYEAGKENGG
ncbi:hypothetical protein GDO86_017811 [Hymenochirus boettgeri]|uniref:Olfactory receptor n=1 Tax=Hymenochirus boettgeri TaxID=247094 RepID=A0A8T2IPA4_9PIPI|nr:hypothetical protein GDO86_017811 [Hymenochirus boettgeri]